MNPDKKRKIKVPLMFTELHQLPRKENNKRRFEVREHSALILKTTRAVGARRRLRLKLSTSPHGRDTQTLRGEERGGPGRCLRSDATWKRRPSDTRRTMGKRLVSRRLKAALWRGLKDAADSCLFRKQGQMWASRPPRS